MAADYMVKKTDSPPALSGDWDHPVWQSARTLKIIHARPESSDHRPKVEARLLYGQKTLYGLYRVEDMYVRAVHQGFQAPVCRDSCVELFCKPHVGEGYFNFEFSCGGSFLCSYVRDWRRIGDAGFADFTMLSAEEGAQVQVYHSLPERVEPELAGPIVWFVQFAIPCSILEAYCGELGSLAGREWSANVYKCGDETSHPHWLSWAPVDELNFHLPRCFQPIEFEA